MTVCQYFNALSYTLFERKTVKAVKVHKSLAHSFKILELYLELASTIMSNLSLNTTFSKTCTYIFTKDEYITLAR